MFNYFNNKHCSDFMLSLYLSYFSKWFFNYALKMVKTDTSSISCTVWILTICCFLKDCVTISLQIPFHETRVIFIVVSNPLFLSIYILVSCKIDIFYSIGILCCAFRTVVSSCMVLKGLYSYRFFSFNFFYFIAIYFYFLVVCY